jgi:CRISPR system Cascade subunit CasA
MVKAQKIEENRFNLIDEDWIPVSSEGLVSLKRIFSGPEIIALGGNPVQKIALTKLLLAICQTAYTPQDDKEWAKTDADGMAKKALAYLKKKRDRFWLYGEKPFLQMPRISQAKKTSLGSVLPFIATGNTTVLTESQKEKSLSEAEKALLIVQLMGFGLGGKKTDNSVVLSTRYHGKINEKGKPSTGKPGTLVGFLGYLHNFLLGDSLLSTLWNNLFTREDINAMQFYQKGLGTAPWEKMPSGEDCSVAKEYRETLMGRLLPLSRFVLLSDDGIHYSEGILHPTYKEGGRDPSFAINNTSKDPKVLWVDPEKRPWRSLTSLLAFLSTGESGSFDCMQIRYGIKRIAGKAITIGIWSGGLRVSSNAGEQFVSGTNDFVESEIFLETDHLGASWFSNFKIEMNALDGLSKTVYGCVLRFYKDQKAEGDKLAGQAANLFWQLCEQRFQNLVDACGDDPTGKYAKDLRPVFAEHAHKAYESFCPKDTARQLEAWAKNRPNLGWYLRGEEAKQKKKS